VSLLARLRPRPELVSLFRTTVLDFWKAWKEDVAALRAAAERKMADLKRRNDQLVEAFIFQKIIDEATYKEQLGRLDEAMALAEIDQHDQRSEELDIEAVLDFAEAATAAAVSSGSSRRTWCPFTGQGEDARDEGWTSALAAVVGSKYPKTIPTLPGAWPAAGRTQSDGPRAEPREPGSSSSPRDPSTQCIRRRSIEPWRRPPSPQDRRPGDRRCRDRLLLARAIGDP
jgi:hypothetical protein